ncbi:low temperature requirement protein A [Cohnella endophytica]|uniref:Low temperature requirement protein A n=1 Tax=Cohnella endophytica TaxID=2419778 RepID=A0A494XE65_9BACL|nr:low temperature requirement protein A [Cohnella endophytica]RKP47961.1 low temperature requirement protein A [Cohnella endophytica]
MEKLTEKAWFRSRGNADSGRVSFIELFFDLVFVFAVTRLSHFFLENFNADGAVRLALLTMAVWMVWIFTVWVINWLNPEMKPVKLMLLVLMLLGLVMSASIPESFGKLGIYFAVSYTLFHVGRTAFTVWMLRKGSDELRINFVRILAWLIASGAFWIAGGIADNSWRLGLWAVAILIEYVGPSLGFWMPKIGRSSTRVWDVEGSHMAERCGLFIIIALGESVLMTGANFGMLEWSPTAMSSFAVSFCGTVAMWWIYFETVAKTGHHYIAHSEDPGRVARSAYTYTHLLVVAGIILSAVADELLLAHPLGHAEAKVAAVMLGGSALYLLGNLLFMRIVTGILPLPFIVSLLALAAVAPFSTMLPPLALSAFVTAVLGVVSFWGGAVSDRLCRVVPIHANKGASSA